MVKQLKDHVVLAGDGCHDSMGHSAKFCAYTCATFPQIIHFDLVQVGKTKCIIITILIAQALLINYSLQNLLHLCVSSLQRNQAGSSPVMEFMAFKLCMDYLITYGLSITTFTSDRHTSIAKYMRDVLKSIVHYFDIWHLKKSKDIPNLPTTILYLIVHNINTFHKLKHRVCTMIFQSNFQ